MMLAGITDMKIARCRKGAAAVEAALLLPVLVVIAFGIIEFGLLLYNQHVITNACREGARAGIVQQVPRVSVSDIQGVVETYSASHLVTFATGAAPAPTVTIPSGSCSAFGDDLTVNVTYPYTFLLFSSVVNLLGPSTLPGTLLLNTQTVMRCE